MLIVLIGPKGSGKSHIGRLLESALGVHFFHVEPHWMTYHQECQELGRKIDLREGAKRVYPRIAEALESHPRVSIETTGASPEILDDLLSFKDRVAVLLVRVSVPLELCLERIEKRDPRHQIPMEEDRIRQVYELSTKVDLDVDLELDNTELSEREILDAFAPFLKV